MTEPAPDTLDDVGVLKRREIEARIVAPLLERLGATSATSATASTTRRAT